MKEKKEAEEKDLENLCVYSCMNCLPADWMVRSAGIYYKIHYTSGMWECATSC